MSILVSAVIPVYNYGRFVARAIDSVLAQTHAPMECVVVDDGSTDDTPQVLSRYGERIRALRQENRGLSAARNAGIRAARGAFVALLDADDTWMPEKIARQLAAAEADPAIGAVGCGYEWIYAGGPPRRFEGKAFPAERAERLRALAMRETWLGGSGSGALVRRKVFDEVGFFDERLRCAEDWDMWLRIADRYRIVNVPEVLVSILQHRTGTFRNAEKFEAAQGEVCNAAAERWPDVLDARLQRRMRALILADAGAEYIAMRQFGKAFERYRASIRAWPYDLVRWGIVARLAIKAAVGHDAGRSAC
jgi:glycosyltransferase involved in cell wall biosynthesis